MQNKNRYLTREEFMAFLKEYREDRNLFLSRFEEMDKRFEAMDKRFEAMDKRFEALRDWVGVVVGGFQVRAGKNLENTVAGALRLALSMYDIEPGDIKLNQKITDTQGLIGPKGRIYQYDILIKNGETYVFEIKSAPDKEDIIRFNDKANLVLKHLKVQRVKKVLVTLSKSEEMAKLCKKLRIVLV